MSTTLNAAGLEPAQSKALKERQMQPHEQKIVQAIKEMYSCKPTPTTFNIYAQDAVFHDPVGIAKGPGSIRAQFVGLAKIFDHATLPKFRLLENPPSVPPSTILIDQDVSYFRGQNSESPMKTLNSLLTLKINAQHQVTSHEEHWNHEKNTTSDDGFLGYLNEQRKKLTASLTDKIIGKDSKT